MNKTKLTLLVLFCFVLIAGIVEATIRRIRFPADERKFIIYDYDAFVLDTGDNIIGDVNIDGTLNMLDNPITNVSYIAFETDANAPPWEEGLLFYDDDAKTIAVYNNESEVSLQVGQEMYLPRPTNKTGSTITNGQLVYVNGAQGSSSTIALAKADDPTTCQVLAMATHDIEDNTKGYVTTFGLVHDVDTDGISAGDAVFLSATTAGAFTDTSPTAPDFVIQVGRCLFENSTSGIITIQIGPTAVCGTMVIQDLDINTNLDVAGTVIGGDATFDTLTLDLGNDYLFTQRGAGLSLAIQNLTPNVTSRLEFFPNIGDGTDALEVSIYAKGTPSDITNRELISLEYVTLPAGGPLFEMHTSASGTGTILPLRIYTGANTSQLVLATNGNVSMAGDLTVNDLIIGDARFIGSASDTDALQIEADGDVVLTQDLYIPANLIHVGDPDTFIAFAPDLVTIDVGGVEFLRFTEFFVDLLTVNNDGADIDFIVNGDTVDSVLKVDAGTDTVNLKKTTVTGLRLAITTKTDTDYTLTATDDTVLFDTGATTRTATLPAASTVTGKVYHIKKIDAGAGLVTIDGDGGEMIDGDLTPDITAQYESFSIVSDGSNWHVI